MLWLLATPAFAGDSLRIVAAHEWGIAADDSRGGMGPGLAGYAGYAFALKVFRFIPEAGVMWAYDRGVVVPRLGARVQIGWLVTPGIFVHGSSAIGDPFDDGTFGFDGGLTLDVALPYVHLGGFGGLQAFSGVSGPDIPDVNFIGGLQLTLAVPTGRKEEDQSPSPSREDPAAAGATPASPHTAR